jgi:hypothetical protein
VIDIFRVLPGGGTLLLYVGGWPVAVVCVRMGIADVRKYVRTSGSMPFAVVWVYSRSAGIPIPPELHLFAVV